MIIPALAFAVSLTLACLGIGAPATTVAALILAGLVIAIAADPPTRRTARQLDGLLGEAFGWRRDLTRLADPAPQCDPRCLRCTMPLSADAYRLPCSCTEGGPAVQCLGGLAYLEPSAEEVEAEIAEIVRRYGRG